MSDYIELSSTLTSVNVLEEEYVRLLGFPRGWVLEGRARELANWAQDWYAHHGKPWIYARQAQHFSICGKSIEIDGFQFSSQPLIDTLQEAEAQSMILVGVGAGPEAEEEAQRRWIDEKPDEYFFLEIYASSVVEYLITLAGAQLCDWAEQRGMAVLPHYSPGYPEWDVAEQARFLELLKNTRSQSLPSEIEVLDTGMLRPKKALLAAFGVTHHKSLMDKVSVLIPCERCSFGPCQYRRAPYRKTPRNPEKLIQARTFVLDRNAQYRTSRKALERWSKERLSLRDQPDGSVEALFRYDGTTCTNMGRPLSFIYRVKFGPRSEKYPILEQQCSPAPGDDGYTYMCRFLDGADVLMKAIETEKPLNREPLNGILEWKRETSVAGCYCDVSSRVHKWGLVLETIHYALSQRELRGDDEEK